MNPDTPLRRVVYVVSLFPCWSETFIVREIGALIENGVDVRIISLKRPCEDMVQDDAAAMTDRVRHPGSLANALRAGVAAFFSKPRTVSGCVWSIVRDGWRQPVVLFKSLGACLRGFEHARWLREFDAQLIYSHWATYPSTAAWALGKLLERPFGFTCHAHDIFVDRQLIGRKIQDAALAVTISRFNVAWLSARVSADAETKMKIVHCGVDLRQMPWVDRAPPPGHAILAVGRLDPIKGFGTLLEALALLKSRGLAFQCRIVGSGPLEAELKRAAVALGIDGLVEFAGARPQSVVREWMNQASVFALPSEVAADGNRDGIPVALMEAMATGCPVVSTRVSGIPELIEHDASGLLVDERDPRALADAIERLLLDAPLRERLALAARHRVEQEFDARKETRRLQDHMQEIAHGR